MHNRNVNLSVLTFLIADPNEHCCAIMRSVLHSFGALAVIQVHDADAAQRVMTLNQIDAFFFDADLPPTGGIEFVRAVRRNPSHPYRSSPIMITAGSATKNCINKARDAGAHMVVTKPFAPSVLYDRLFWVAFHARNFFESDKYYGPDRRFKFEEHGGARRRKGDQAANVRDVVGPTPSQDDINSLLTVAHDGQS